LYSMNMSITK